MPQTAVSQISPSKKCRSITTLGGEDRGGHPYPDPDLSKSRDEKVDPILVVILSPLRLPAHDWSIMCLSKQCHRTHQYREIDFLGSILPGV